MTRILCRVAGVGALLAPSALPQDVAVESPTAPILSAMEELESARDAKCHSTACRFENFVFGTPLGDAARDAKVALQKELIGDVWGRASRAAKAVGGATVGREAIEAELARVLRAQDAASGDRLVTFPGTEPITLPAVRLAQYGSIAYSLRAILSVQQDYLLRGGEVLLPLGPEAIDVLGDAVDTVTLCALMRADEAARLESAAELDAGQVTRAWRELVPAEAPERDDGQDGASVAASEAMRREALDVLRGLIREKTAAYAEYNAIGEADRGDRFLTNLERFYALYDVPPTREATEPILKTFDNAVVSFSAELLRVAPRLSEANGHDLIRSDDAVRAVQVATPCTVDDFEDVHFFPRLGRHRQVTLEAYDCDSFRDLGMHWGYLEQALDTPTAPPFPPDPFAAEIIAECISQYGVLLPRVAGQVARERGVSRTLTAEDFERAAQRILRRARQNQKAPERAPADPQIVSVAETESARSTAALFADVTRESGIDFLHRSSVWLSEFRRERTAGPPTFSGGGVAAEDLDGDLDPDLLFVGGIGVALYENEGGRFVDVTERAGIGWTRPDGSTGEARQPIFADFDNDGRPDVLITYANDRHRLYRNLGDWRFEDATERAGLGGEGLIGGPATVFDFDGDALLDVYLGYFGNYLEGAIPTVDRDNRNALPNRLFRNLGGLRFGDVTDGSGTDDTGWCQAVSHTDFDRDGRPDLVVANDFGRNVFLQNLGGGRFRNVAPELGLTKAYHSMNVGVTDLNADDCPDIYISNIATLVKDNKYVLPDVNTPLDFSYDSMATMLVKESDVLYMSRVEDGVLTGFVPSGDIERGATSTGWAWDAEFLDIDHDGDDDLYVVNGTNDYHYYASIHPLEGKDGEVRHHYLSHARESNVLFLNQGGKLRNVSSGSGADLLLNSRSTAYLDVDGDGDLDVAINNFHSPAVLLRNDAPKQGNWMRVQLVGDPARGSNRDAIGARLVATADGGLRVSREIQGGSGYLSSNPKTVHLGVGAAQEVDLRIVWPNGEVQTVEGLAANRRHVVRQGDARDGGD